MNYIDEKQGMKAVRKVAAAVVHAKVKASELTNCGWLPNLFFDRDAPCLRRSNVRCSMRHFWKAFSSALSASDFFSRPIVFHENLGGWAGRGLSRFIKCESLSEAVSFLRDHSYYNPRAWQVGSRSDNYEILDPENMILGVLTHHGDMYFFASDPEALVIIRRCLRKSGMRSTMFSPRSASLTCTA